MVHYNKDHTVNGKAVPQLGSNADGTSTQEWNQAIFEFLSALKPVTAEVTGEHAAPAKKPVDVLFKSAEEREKDADTVSLVIKVLSSAVPSSVYGSYLREDGDLPEDQRACTELKLDGFTVQKVDPWKLFRYRMAVGGDIALVGGSADDIEDELLEHEYDSKGTYVEQIMREAKWLIDWRARMSSAEQSVSPARLRSYLRTAIKNNMPEVYNVDMISKDTFASLKTAMLKRANDLDKGNAPGKRRSAKAFGAFNKGRDNSGGGGGATKRDGWKEPCKNFKAGRCTKSAEECPYFHPRQPKGGSGAGRGDKNRGDGGGGGNKGEGCYECGSHSHKVARCPNVPLNHRPTAAVCVSKEEYAANFSGNTHNGGVGAFKQTSGHGAFVTSSAGGVHGARETKECVQDIATGVWHPTRDSG